jgi:hypothetical protein
LIISLLSHKVTLIIPGLIDPVPHLEQFPAQELPHLPLFSTLLARGRFVSPENPDLSGTNFYTCLLKALLFHDKQSAVLEQFPIASVSYFMDNNNESLNKHLNKSWIIRVTPCFITPDRDQLILAKIHESAISMSDAKQYVDEINQFFQQYREENFWKLYALTPYRWYIICDKPVELDTLPPEKIVGQSLKNYLPKGADKQHWINLINEFQMILHQSPLNQLRIQEKKHPVNSLWLWGEGYALVNKCPIKDINYLIDDKKIIYSHHIFAQGLAKLQQQTTNNLPKKYQFIDSKNVSSSIFVIEDLMQSVQNNDIFSWLGQLKQFEQDYLEPIFKQLKLGKVNELEIISPTGRRIFLTKLLLKRWWRKKRTIIYLNSLGK